ncbi:hypothetical protein LIS82_26840 (plasmid) [Cytobacillus solani]|uniref:hypothetical protein n=1 Tax=Cytobacillus solani TaxID=1637975 RepID=UPI00207A89E8|nr:hypothetical protein [Cytobacillus solani]USK57838.1 hypothetical protein LIS82_26840 [Cytobacillus solani]
MIQIDWITKVIDWMLNSKVFIGILFFIIGAIFRPFFSELVKDFYSGIKNKLKKSKSIFIYEWMPIEPIKNIKANKIIDNFPKSVGMVIEDGYIDITLEWVKGFDAFEQSLIKLINTPRDKYKVYEGTDYGVSFLFQTVTNDDEFKRYSMVISEDIIRLFSEWIREVYFIKKYKDRNELQIGLGLNGRHEIVRIDIPLLKGTTG